MSKAGMPVNRRPKPKKEPRPKSQPPGMLRHGAPGAQSSPSHSSQEDLVKQRTYCKNPSAHYYVYKYHISSKYGTRCQDQFLMGYHI